MEGKRYYNKETNNKQITNEHDSSLSSDHLPKKWKKVTLVLPKKWKKVKKSDELRNKYYE